MARANTVTLLSLDRFAKIIGINPAHFNQAYAPSLNPAVFPINNVCSDIWFQYDWQSNQISREGLAMAIQNAEDDISRRLGYNVAPKWIAQDIYQYPRHYNPRVYGNGLNVRGQMKSISLRSGKFLQGGRRNVTLIGTATTAGATLVYSDEDGDGLDETATITLTTTLTDACEIKAYFAGNSGNQEWEIREPKSVTISGGSVILVFNSWQLIDPDLWEMFPNANDEPATVDISTTANFITSIDIYREYNDFTQASSQLLWEKNTVISGTFPNTTCSSCSGSGCAQCSLTTQDGCMQVRNVTSGEVVPIPATYDATLGQWTGTTFGECREPDMVKFWYKAGECSNDFLRGVTCDPLSNYWAETITWLTVAKLDKPFCSCQGVNNKIAWLQTDLGASTGETSYFLDASLAPNPFGTRRGAIMAWQRVEQLNNKLSMEVHTI